MEKKTEQSRAKGSRNKTDPEHTKHKKSFEIKFFLESLEKPVQAPVGIYEGQNASRTEVWAPRNDQKQQKRSPNEQKKVRILSAAVKTNKKKLENQVLESKRTKKSYKTAPATTKRLENQVLESKRTKNG